MRKFHYALLVGAALFAATSAQAVVTITFDDGIGGLQPGEVLFANFNSSGSLGGVSGSNYLIMTGSVSGQGADPAVGDQGDPYLSVGATGSGIATFNFASQPGGGISHLGLDYGSADDYNSFVLYLSDGTTTSTESFTGSQAIAAAANGNQTSPVTNGRLTFTTSTGLIITRIDLTSTSAALEADNFGVIAAVPEPGTWGMMLLGFGAMAVSLRRRRRALPKLAQAV